MANLFAGFKLKDMVGKSLSLSGCHMREQCFDGWNKGWAHAEFPQAKPEKHQK
jgi:hypothetical protein